MQRMNRIKFPWNLVDLFRNAFLFMILLSGCYTNRGQSTSTTGIQAETADISVHAAALNETGVQPAKQVADTDFHLSEPFWKSTISWRESVFFVQEADGQASADLLFPPSQVISVHSARGDITYTEGKDFDIAPGSRRIVLTPGSHVPFKPRAELYPQKNTPGAMPHKQGDPNHWLYFGEGHLFHDQQVEVTYRHSGTWKGYVPEYANAILARTITKLKAKQPLKIALIGDSISEGYNASGFTNAPPHMPAYGQLIAQDLERQYGCKVTLYNFAIAGRQAVSAGEDAQKVAAVYPDLVIVAYGMNDVGRRNPDAYRDEIGGAMTTIKSVNPEVEFVLVSSMLGNSEWSSIASDQFIPYRDILKSLTGQSVALADMTALWIDLLKLKNFHDLTGNGVNHPNDFGHRLYAQVILTLLIQ